MPRPDARRPPAPHWHPGTSSCAGSEAAHRLLILVHPSPELLIGKTTRLRQWRLFLVQALREEKQQLRLLSRRQFFDGTFDLSQRLHGAILPSDSRAGNAHSNRNLPAHQPRQQQVARGAKLLVLQVKYFDLLENPHSELAEQV
jgi:hypothetical protein